MAMIVLLSDLKDLRKQKEQELKYYSDRLEQLNKKLFFIRKEIELTNFIIDLIEKEKIVDLRKLLNDSIDKKSD
jgi:hypothetical protein